MFAHDNSVRAAFLDSTTGFFNATSVCLCVAELAHLPHVLELNPPALERGWQVATALSRAPNTAERGFGEYVASDYDELAALPCAHGDFDLVDV